MQIIRVGQIAASIYGAVPRDEEPVGIELPKVGAKISLLRDLSPSNDGNETSKNFDKVSKESVVQAGTPFTNAQKSVHDEESDLSDYLSDEGRAGVTLTLDSQIKPQVVKPGSAVVGSDNKKRAAGSRADKDRQSKKRKV
ncbi:hypothetical protein MD484_g6246, partial [Candolleomyces efflorescens]